MRISTAFSFQMNTTALQSRLADLNQVQQQIATGRRIVTPSDDPVGAAYALQVAQELAKSSNYTANITAAKTVVNRESVALDAIRKVLVSARSVATGAAGNPDTQTRTQDANYLQEIYQDLLGYANSTDSNGNYMFSGSKGSTTPFQQVTGASNYQGDNLQQSIAISNSRQIPINDSGQSVFGVGTANDPFKVIDQFITDLRNGALTGTAFDTAVSTALTGLSNAVDTVVNVQDQVGVRSQELDDAQTAQTNFTSQFQNELERVESVDMQKAALQLQAQQLSLQALQQTVASTGKLSLFNFL